MVLRINGRAKKKISAGAGGVCLMFEKNTQETERVEERKKEESQRHRLVNYLLLCF